MPFSYTYRVTLEMDSLPTNGFYDQPDMKKPPPEVNVNVNIPKVQYKHCVCASLLTFVCSCSTISLIVLMLSRNHKTYNPGLREQG